MTGALRRILPTALQATVTAQPAAVNNTLKQSAVGLLAAIILSVSMLKIYELASGQSIPGTLGKALKYTTGYSIVNKYHVFPTMTTRRVELEVLGSLDGINWKPYRFKYKPDLLEDRPQFIIPHQPRLDWQMWFVTLHPRHLPWFGHFLEALLDNSPRVTALLAHNPFPGDPPRYLRVDAYQYNFTDPDERAATGNWWKRTPLGPFTPLPGLERPEPAEAGKP